MYLNGEELPVKTFRDYIDLYIEDKIDESGNPLKLAYEKVNDHWEIAVTASFNNKFQQASMVNAIATSKGGYHVDAALSIVGKA